MIFEYSSAPPPLPTHTEVRKVLYELRSAVDDVTDPKWHIRQWRIKPGWFRRSVDRFELLYRVKGQFQIINFYMPNTGTSINTMVPAEVAIAYMYGIIGGYTDLMDKAEAHQKT